MGFSYKLALVDFWDELTCWYWVGGVSTQSTKTPAELQRSCTTSQRGPPAHARCAPERGRT
eukprot:15437203-Alexandrium_andersonii.AAC.1